jgi:hypothetical protein
MSFCINLVAPSCRSSAPDFKLKRFTTGLWFFDRRWSRKRLPHVLMSGGSPRHIGSVEKENPSGKAKRLAAMLPILETSDRADTAPGQDTARMDHGRFISRTAWCALSSMLAYGLAMSLLCMPAIWNGFPLVHDDLGGYLERWPLRSLGHGRSVPYGLLLWATRTTWWIPTILLQSIVTVWTVDRALAVFGRRRSQWTVVYVVASIAMTSGVAFFVSKIMPDAWAAPAIISLHLMAWHSDQLSALERAVMIAIVVLAGAFHMATLAVLLALSILHGVAWALVGKARGGAVGLLYAGGAVWTALAALLASDLVVAGRFTVTPGGDVFLFARLTQSGIIGKVLAAECPREDWLLCNFRNDLPPTADGFLWVDDSPFYKIGGWDDRRAKREIESIIAESVRTRLFDHMESAVALAARQLVTVGIGNGMARINSWHTPWTIDRYTPWLSHSYETARQQRGDIDLTRWSQWVVSPISIAGLCALPLVAIFSWRRGYCREAMFPAMVLLALLINAAVCGIFSGPNGRYQARVAWLSTFSSILTLAAASYATRQASNSGTTDAIVQKRDHDLGHHPRI